MESVSLGGRPVSGFGLGAPFCPALPSGSAAVDLLRGNWVALPGVIGSMVARSALIASGMYVVGERDHLMRNALGGGLAIETFVLAWAAWKLSQEPAA